MAEGGEIVTGTLYDGHTVTITGASARLGGAWQMRDTEGKPLAYDPGLVKLFAEQVSKKPNALVVDVGASTGSYSLLPTVLDCRIVAFEPNPDAARELRRNIALNDISNSVSVHEVALSDGTGEVTLAVPILEAHAAVACIHPGVPRPRGFQWKEITVRTDELDSFDLLPDFVKIDTEGAELLVLQGAEDTIERFHPDILIEYASENTKQFGYDAQDIIAWLIDHGYHSFRTVGLEDLWATT